MDLTPQSHHIRNPSKSCWILGLRKWLSVAAFVERSASNSVASPSSRSVHSSMDFVVHCVDAILLTTGSMPLLRLPQTHRSSLHLQLRRQDLRLCSDGEPKGSCKDGR